MTGIVFVCFPFVSVLFLTLLFCFRKKLFCLFVVHLFVRFVFLFPKKNDAALLLESRSANANAE